MFFNTADLKPSSLSMPTVNQWAADVCQNHLKDGADPTECLCKIARANSLTPHQIEVLAGEINKLIHTAKYASVEDKYHAADFPLADSRKALSSLQVGPQTTKLALVMPEPNCKQDFDYFKAFGIEPDTQEKRASVQEVCQVQQKLGSLARKQADSAYMAKVACECAEVSFIKEARQLVLTGLDQRDRLKKLGTAIHAVKCTDTPEMVELAAKPLAKLAYSLGEEGLLTRGQAQKVIDYLLEKKADLIVPDELISEFMNAKVVNGNHPLLITLKTYADAKERERNEHGRHNIIDDKNKILGQKIRAL
jgi:hypothetical protein